MTLKNVGIREDQYEAILDIKDREEIPSINAFVQFAVDEKLKLFARKRTFSKRIGWR